MILGKEIHLFFVRGRIYLQYLHVSQSENQNIVSVDYV